MQTNGVVLEFADPVLAYYDPKRAVDSIELSINHGARSCSLDAEHDRRYNSIAKAPEDYQVEKGIGGCAGLLNSTHTVLDASTRFEVKAATTSYEPAVLNTTALVALDADDPEPTPEPTPAPAGAPKFDGAKYVIDGEVGTLPFNIFLPLE